MFPSADVIEEYFALHYKTDFTFKKHMLVVKIGEKGHVDRDPDYERKRQKDLEKVDYYLFRINPDKLRFNDYEDFGRVSGYIAESTEKETEKSTKKSLINDLSKRLLEELELKKYHSIKSKCLKQILKKILPDYKESKTAIKN